MRLRVLLVAEGYPPEPAVGAFRIRKLAHAFVERGHHVAVVVALAGKASNPVDQTVDVRVTGISANPREVLGRWQKRLRFSRKPSAVPGVEVAPGGVERPEQPGAGLRNLMVSLMHLPDDQQGLVRSLLSGVRQTARGQSFDIVYGSAPSFSVSVAARMAARRLGIPLILEFRDPWYLNGGARLAHLHPFTKWLDGALERWCLSRAKTIVAVTEGAAKYFRDRKKPGQEVLVGLNGIDRLEKERVTVAPHERLRVVYSGSLYPPRDPRPLMASIARVANTMKLAPPEFAFVGQCHEYEGQRLRDFAVEHGIGENFQEIEWLPQQQAFALNNEADLLLLPAQRWVDQIPNKLFDYLGSRVPILCLAEKGSDPENLLQQAGGHFVSCTDAPEQLDVVTERALQAARVRMLCGDSAVLQTLTSAAQFSTLVGTIEQLYAAT